MTQTDYQFRPLKTTRLVNFSIGVILYIYCANMAMFR